MELTNYWWLLLWPAVVGAFLILFPLKQREKVMGQYVERWNILPAAILAAPYVIWAAFRPDGWGDTSSYRFLYDMVPSSLGELTSYVSSQTKDKGFAVLSVLIKTFFGNSDVVFFFILALLQMIYIVVIFRKYSCNYWLSIFLFVASTDYMSWMHNGIRQFTAVALVFAGTGLMLKKKYVPLIILILVASTIHGSALMMIPIVFIVQGKAWNKKTLVFILGVMIAILFIGRLTPILNDVLVDTQYSDLVTNDLWSTDDGTNILRVLVYSMPAILSLLGIKYVREANDPVINLSVNCSIITAAIYALSG